MRHIIKSLQYNSSAMIKAIYNAPCKNTEEKVTIGILSLELGYFTGAILLTSKS